MDLDARLSDRVSVNSCDGNASLICAAPPDSISWVKEDAEDRSDRKLSVRVMERRDGSELADETEGDSVSASEAVKYCGGVWVTSVVNLGWASSEAETDAGSWGRLAGLAPGVGIGIGGLSSSDGRVDLM